MNRPILVALLVLVAGSGIEARGGFGGGNPPGALGGPGGPARSACSTALAPSSTEVEQLRDAVETCITEQDGLQAIVDELQEAGGPRGCVVTLLEDNDYTTEATKLRECIAREVEILATDGTVDMDVLEASILAKVADLSIAANTQLGLDNCPAVVEFDLAEYLNCIMAYCETGAAP